MSKPASGVGERVLIVAPIGADARNLHRVLAQVGIDAGVHPEVGAAIREAERGCGALLLTEEALPGWANLLGSALDRQPSWSDLPLILIVSAGPAATDSEPVRRLRSHTNVTLVERPLRRETLISTVTAALRARRRQYEVRDLLRERDELLASLEQRVVDRTAKLQELNAELEAFSYSISHDLRAPLRSMESYSRLLCEDFGAHLPPEAKHYLQRIAKNAGKMDQLMRDVLTFSRAARGEIQLKAIDLDDIVADTIEQYPDLSGAQNRIDVRSPLGTVLGHAPSLTQCFSNLLQNALKFSSGGGTPGRVNVYSEFFPGRVRVSVRDYGIGIETAHQARIFGLFERASPAAIPGTGIGLAIVKKCVERMNGNVGVVSAPGSGSCFWMELATPAPHAVDGVNQLEHSA